MTSKQKVVFFIDRCFGKHIVKNALIQAGEIAVSHDDEFPSDTEDVVWMPDVAAKEWVILTKDNAIQKNLLELQCAYDSNVRMFALGSRRSFTGAQTANIFVQSIPNIYKVLQATNAPFITRLYADLTFKIYDGSAMNAKLCKAFSPPAIQQPNPIDSLSEET